MLVIQTSVSEALLKQISQPLVLLMHIKTQLGGIILSVLKFAGRPFDKAFLMSAGTEATEAAMKLMRMNGQKQGRRREALYVLRITGMV